MIEINTYVWNIIYKSEKFLYLGSIVIFVYSARDAPSVISKYKHEVLLFPNSLNKKVGPWFFL